MFVAGMSVGWIPWVWVGEAAGAPLTCYCLPETCCHMCVLKCENLHTGEAAGLGCTGSVAASMLTRGEAPGRSPRMAPGCSGPWPLFLQILGPPAFQGACSPGRMLLQLGFLELLPSSSPRKINVINSAVSFHLSVLEGAAWSF